MMNLTKPDFDLIRNDEVDIQNYCLGGGGTPLLEIEVIKGILRIIRVIKHFEQFAEGEKNLGKFRRRRKKIGGIFTG